MTQCTHLNQIKEVTPSADGCEECLKIGSWWVHLRLCLICGHVGCCDNSPILLFSLCESLCALRVSLCNLFFGGIHYV